MARIISIEERNQDFEKLDILITSLEQKAISKKLNSLTLRNYQESFSRFNDKYKNDQSISEKDKNLYMPLELRALILLAQGKKTESENILIDALSLKKPNEVFISNYAKKWESRYSHSSKVGVLMSLYSTTFILVPAYTIHDLFVSAPALKKSIVLTEGFSIQDYNSYLKFLILFYGLTLFILIKLGISLFSKRKNTKKTAIILHGLIILGCLKTFKMLSNIQTKYDIKQSKIIYLIPIISVVWLIFWVFSKNNKYSK